MKSMLDTVISEETAKLFNKETYTYPVEYSWVNGKLIDVNLLKGDEESYEAPSLCMVMKFLRDERGIIITPSPLPGNRWMSEIFIQDSGKLISSGRIVCGDSWEEVVEEQIKNIYYE